MPRKANTVTLDVLNRSFYIEDSQLKWKIAPCPRYSTRINQVAGSFKTNGYRKVTLNGVTLLVHRIMYQMYNSIELLDSFTMIDHIDGDVLNNSVSNLRTVDNFSSVYNTKGYSTAKYKGVSIRKHTKKYLCRIMVDRKEIFLGYYDTAIEAAKVYDLNAIKYQGNYAKLNFPH